MNRWWILVVTTLWLSACDRVGDSQAGTWLQNARASHAAIEAGLAGGDCRKSFNTLQAMMQRPIPNGIQDNHRRVVLQDACFLVARCYLAAEEPARAQEVAEQGLGRGRAVDVFTANLWIVQGKALEAQKRDAEAVVAYEQAMDVTEQLLQGTLESNQRGESP